MTRDQRQLTLTEYANGLGRMVTEEREVTITSVVSGTELRCIGALVKYVPVKEHPATPINFTHSDAVKVASGKAKLTPGLWNLAYMGLGKDLKVAFDIR